MSQVGMQCNAAGGLKQSWNAVCQHAGALVSAWISLMLHVAHKQNASD